MGEWKKVLDDNSYSAREKYESIMEQVNVMEEKAKQKEEQMKSYKKGDKSIELKGQMDKFYLESVAAKLVVLKDVILK
jgi:vacuolar-type H+-ATPase catalytic subunit A/Vma1